MPQTSARTLQRTPVRPPVRVEIFSDSHIVREGLVGLVAALGGAAIVVDDVSNDAENMESTNRDVILLDLGAVDGLTAYERLRHTCRRGVPVIALVYDTEGPGPRSPHRNPTDHLHTITLSVTPAELGDLLEQVVSARSPRHGCTHELPCELTEREYEVVSMIGQGLCRTKRSPITCSSVSTASRPTSGRPTASSM